MNIKNSCIKGNSVSCLLEYLNGIAEVVGSTPTRSTFYCEGTTALK